MHIVIAAARTLLKCIFGQRINAMARAVARPGFNTVVNTLLKCIL